MRSIRGKLLLLIAVLVIGSLFVQNYFVSNVARKELGIMVEEQLNQRLASIEDNLEVQEENRKILEAQLLKDYDVLIKHEVDTVLSLVDHVYDQYLAEAARVETAEERQALYEAYRAEAVELVRPLRYDDGNYFWIDDGDYKSVLLPPDPSVEGTSRANLSDVNGTMIVQEFVDGAESFGYTYLDYYFPKPGSTVPEQKRGYVGVHEPFDFFIGTGNYLDTLLVELADFDRKQHSVMQNQVESIEDGTQVFVLNRDNTVRYANVEGMPGEAFILAKGDGKYLINAMEETRRVYDFSIRDDRFDGTYAVSYIDRPDLGVKVLIMKHHDLVYASLNAMLAAAMKTLAGVVVAALLLTLLVANYLTHPIKRLREDMEGVATGDLSVEAAVTTKDEIGELATTFNLMVDKLKDLVQNARGISESVSSTSALISEMIGQTTLAIEQVAETTEDISAGAGEQVSATMRGVEATTALDGESKAIVEKTKIMRDTVQGMTEQNKHGMQVMTTLIEKQEHTVASVGDIGRIIGELNDRVFKINEFTDAIDDIAEQTNLLALNASIEAARAGEHGRGFAVVAEEIRKLAEESSVSAGEIKDIVSSIQNETKRAVNVVKTTEQTVQEQDRAFSDTQTVFKTLEHSVEETAGQIDGVYGAMGNFDGLKNKVVELVDQIHSVAENTAASTVQVSASVEEQTATMNELNQKIAHLAAEAESLRDSLGQFKV